MAQSVPSGDIQTQPNAKIVFNAPYDDNHTYYIKVINSSARRIGYGIKTTNMKRFGVDPPCRRGARVSEELKMVLKLQDLPRLLSLELYWDPNWS